MWSWECSRSIDRRKDVAVRQSFFLVAAVISAILYAFVIRTLLATRQNPRKVALVKAFVALYLLWLVCFIPYDVLEVYYLNSNLINNLFKDFAPVAFKENIGETISMPNVHNVLFSGEAKQFIIVEAVLGNLRVSFGLLNSILLFVLLKPFREPPKKLYNTLGKLCHA